MIARVLYPYAGRIEATGRVGALIEVAGGLHPDLTGRENVQLYGALLGLGRSEVNASFDEILAFAGIEAAIDRQVKFYSSGMKLRLGFSVAAFLRPAILLVDEALAVGDVQFQRKCLERMHQTLDEGTTLIHVSHDMEAIKATCKRVIWLDQGVVKSDGPAEEVLGGYLKAFEGLSEEERNALVPRRR
jgi:ABC-2 type transport system ATP-binding protein